MPSPPHKCKERGCKRLTFGVRCRPCNLARTKAATWREGATVPRAKDQRASTSWWVGAPRETFGQLAAREAQRMNDSGVNYTPRILEL